MLAASPLPTSRLVARPRSPAAAPSSASSSSPTSSTAPRGTSPSATWRAPRTMPTGSWTSRDSLGVAVEASVQTDAHRHLGPVAPQPRLPRGAARRAAGLADLPLPPLAAALRAAAQHDPRHLADLDPGLRPVPRRAAAARRQRAGRHDQLADRLRDGLEPDDQLLQRAGRGPEPARRLRVRGRHRARRVVPQPARSSWLRICGGRRSRSRSSPPATTTSSTSWPGWSPPRSGTASAWRSPAAACRARARSGSRPRSAPCSCR